MRHSSTIADFLTGRALPLWADAGVDHVGGGFVERLDAEGRPDLAATKRVRVQARQIYVYAHAAILGLWPDGAALAMRGFDFLDRYARAEGGGFVHATSREGQVCDARCDSYDHAFLLFAFAWLYRATGAPIVRAAIDDVAATIVARLTLPGGGVAVDTGSADERQQNPNMHLFEAYLAVAEATGDERFLAAADTQHALFARHLFDRKTSALREYYVSDWRPAPGERGVLVEPGHHCEWLWLLKRHADAHRRPVGEEVAALAAFVERYGRPDGGVLLIDEVAVDGRPRRTATRIWPQTEAIKAEIALAEVADTVPSPRIDAIVDALFDRFLDQPIPGGWIDWRDPAGTPLVKTVPASTFYHLFLAFAEYRTAAAGAAKGFGQSAR